MTSMAPPQRRGPRPGPRGRVADAEARAAVAEATAGLAARRDLLIEHLHALQDRHGCLRAGHLVALAERLRLAPVEVFEVATFYHHFDVLEDVGPGARSRDAARLREPALRHGRRARAARRPPREAARGRRARGLRARASAPATAPPPAPSGTSWWSAPRPTPWPTRSRTGRRRCPTRPASTAISRAAATRRCEPRARTREGRATRSWPRSKRARCGASAAPASRPRASGSW